MLFWDNSSLKALYILHFSAEERLMRITLHFLFLVYELKSMLHES